VKLGEYELNQIYTGDARELAKGIPDESVDLIFTDPVYQNLDDYWWLANTAARVLKNNSACLMWQGQQWLDKTFIILSTSPLSYRWPLGWYAGNNMQMVGKIARKSVPLLWYEKGKSEPVKAFHDMLNSPIINEKVTHKWMKQSNVITSFLEKFASPGDIVLDTFTGAGTVPCSCKKLGINFIAFEIDSKKAEEARENLMNTQDPLPFYRNDVSLANNRINPTTNRGQENLLFN